VRAGAGVGDQVFVDVDRRDLAVFAGQVREQAGVVAGTGADFEDSLAWLDLELFKHRRDDPWL
jgi:hypothetical protein